MIPSIKWYQRNEYISINLSMSSVDKIVPQELNISYDNDLFEYIYQNYKFSQKLNLPCENLQINISGRSVNVKLNKRNAVDDWTNLFQDKLFNKQYVKIDWNNWMDSDVDEDKDNHNEPSGDQQFNMEQLKEMMAHYQNEESSETPIFSEKDILSEKNKCGEESNDCCNKNCGSKCREECP